MFESFHNKKLKKSHTLHCSGSESYISENLHDHANNSYQTWTATRNRDLDGHRQECGQVCIGTWDISGDGEVWRIGNFEWPEDNLQGVGEKAGSGRQETA